MNFTLGLSKGFRNVPNLYGDKSVRETPKITGFKSGIKAAGKVICFSFTFSYAVPIQATNEIRL